LNFRKYIACKQLIIKFKISFNKLLEKERISRGDRYRPAKISYQKDLIRIEDEEDIFFVHFVLITSVYYRKKNGYHGNHFHVFIGIVLLMAGCNSFSYCVPFLAQFILFFSLFYFGGKLFYIGMTSDEYHCDNVYIETMNRTYYFSVNELSGETVVTTIEEKMREFKASNA
jgi:hypothetical protein